MADHIIHLIGGSDDETATLSSATRDGRCLVSLSYRDRVIEAVANDYFEAFSQIRLQLESEHLIPFCYGSSLNVFPSGICRDMGSGLSAYRLTLGRPAAQNDRVRIFDAGSDVIPASVANQKGFFADWQKSLSPK